MRYSRVTGKKAPKREYAGSFADMRKALNAKLETMGCATDKVRDVVNAEFRQSKRLAVKKIAAGESAEGPAKPTGIGHEKAQKAQKKPVAPSVGLRISRGGA